MLSTNFPTARPKPSCRTLRAPKLAASTQGTTRPGRGLCGPGQGAVCELCSEFPFHFQGKMCCLVLEILMRAHRLWSASGKWKPSRDGWASHRGFCRRF